MPQLRLDLLVNDQGTSTMKRFAEDSDRAFKRVEKSANRVSMAALPEQERAIEKVKRKYIGLYNEATKLEKTGRISKEIAAQWRESLGVQMNADIKKLGEQGDKTFSGLKSAGVSAAKAIGAAFAVAAAAVAYAGGRLAKESAMAFSRYETLGVVEGVVGRNAGYGSGELERRAQALQKYGIAMTQSRQAVISMTQAEIDLSRSTQLARIAQDAAVIGQMNSSEALGKLVYGIQSAQIDVLRTIGINVNFEQSYKKLAAQLGISATALTQQQKTQARLNAVMEEGAKIAGTYEAAMTTAGKKMSSFTRYVDDYKVKMGEAFGPATSDLIDHATDLMKELQEQITKPEAQRALRQMAGDFADIAKSILDASKNIAPLLRFASLRGISGTVNEAAELSRSGQLGIELSDFMHKSARERQDYLDFQKERLRLEEQTIYPVKAGKPGSIIAAGELASLPRSEVNGQLASEADVAAATAAGTLADLQLSKTKEQLALEAATSAATASSAKLAKQWADTKIELSTDVSQLGLTGLDLELAKINEKADKLRGKFGDKPEIAAWATAEGDTAKTKEVNKLRIQLQKEAATGAKETAAANQKLAKSYDEITMAALPKQAQAIEQVNRQYDDLREQLDGLQESGKITIDEEIDLWGQLDARQGEALDSMAAKTDTTAQAMSQAFSGWANGFSSDLNDMLWSADYTFNGILESFGKMVTQMMIQKSMVEPFVNGVTDGGMFDWLGGLFGGGKAVGGSTAPGMFYEVNEQGPELYSTGGKTYLMTGSQGGYVTPAGGGGGGRGGSSAPPTITIINKTSTPIKQDNVRVSGNGRSITVELIEVVDKAIAGGRFNRSMSAAYNLNPATGSF